MNKELLNFENFEISDAYSTFNVQNYNSIDLSEIRDYLDGLPDHWFRFLKLHEGDKIEKVLYDYYGSSDFFDLILFLNKRNMIFDMPYSYDVILDAIEKDINEYQYKVFGNTTEQLSEKTFERLKNTLDNNYSTKNEKFIYLKVISAENIDLVRRKVQSILNIQKEMYSIIEV